jgi:hypothetical protein
MQKIKQLFYGMVLSATFFSCNKTNDENLALQINEEKQISNVQFGNYAFAQQRGTATNGNALQASNASGGEILSKVIALSNFKTEAPFVSVYGAVNGEQLEKENVTIAFSGSADGENWDQWIAVRPSDDAEATNSKLAFGNVELDKATKFVKFKFTFLNDKAKLNNASFYFFNPQKTSAEEQARIDETAKIIAQEREIAEGSANVSNLATNPALCAKPSFTARATWGARAPRSAASTSTVNFIIVHHEEGSNSSTDWAARVRAVQNLHMDVNGWADIAYNYLVDPNGVPYEGRGGGENVVGAHLCGKNTNTMGICMLGSFTSQLPTNNALYSLKRILAWKCVQRNLDPNATGFHVDRTINRVSGHRTSCSTDCPGTTLFNYLPTLRNDLNTNFIAKCK